MAKTLALMKNDTETEQDKQASSIWRERPLSDRWLVRGQDETGRRGWFLRLEITGLYARRVGPFPTRAAALTCLETVLTPVVTDVLCDLKNGISHSQRCVIEGIPQLKGR